MINDYSNGIPKTRIKKDYQAKSFHNPYFYHGDENKRPGRFNTRKYLRLLAIILVLYVIIYSDLFKIKHVSISGTEMIPKEEVEQLVWTNIQQQRWLILPQDNFLLLSKNKLAQTINQTYSLNKLSINKNWHNLNLEIEEKITYLIIFNQKEFYFADSTGTATKQIDQGTAEQYWSRFPLINIGEKQITIGDHVIDEKIVKYFLDLNNLVVANNIPIYGYELRGVDDISLVSREGWRGYFSLDVKPQQSVDNLLLVMKEKISNRTNLEYIDLRFGDKVFYK